MTTLSNSIAALGLTLVLGNDAAAQAGNWATSWYAAPQPGWDRHFVLPMNVPAVLDRQTVHESLRLSAGGKRFRLVYSNRYGRGALTLGEVRVALGGQAGPPHLVRFAGRTAATIPPGATLASDPVALSVPALARLDVRTWLPAPTPVTSFHWGGQQTLRLSDGRNEPQRAEGRLFLSAVQVDAGPGARTVVALGDSITDGNGSTPDADRRWPDFLARRLAPHGVAVANASISGGRLLRDGMGESALARFERDVLAQPGVSDVIVLLGINDIGWPGSPFAPGEHAVTLDQLRAGYQRLADAAHARGLRITAATLPPFEGALEGTPFAGHYSPAKEALRLQLNDWLRGAGVFDAVVDFDAVLRDPGRPQRMRAEFDSGDHLHPGDAGYRAMADAIDIAPFLAQVRP